MFSKLALSAIALAAMGSAQSTDGIISTSDDWYGTTAATDVSTSSIVTSTTSSSVTSSATGVVHSVAVGKGGLNFSPASISAAVGDTIEFSFASAPHSVTQGDFSNPCQPSNGSGFNSDTVNSPGQTFTISVNSTDPIYFYCAVSRHCQNDMVGAINAPAGKGAAEYAAAAAKAPNSNAPSQLQGGTLDDGSATSSSSSGTPAPGTSKTGTSSSGPSSTGAAPSASGTHATGDASSTFKVGSFSVLLAVAVMLLGNPF